MATTNFLKYRLPAIFYAIVIFTQSSFSHIPTPSIGLRFQDKLIHAIVYGILGFLSIRAFYYKSNDFMRRNALVLSFSISFLYALSDELHQAFVPGRTAEIGDLIADFIGILTAEVIFFYRKINFRKPGIK